MKISKKTKELIEELNEYSGAKLKNPVELSYLVEIASLSEKDKLFYDIQFIAKYLNGLTKILQTNVDLSSQKNGDKVSNEEAREKIMGEFKANMVKLTNYLKDLLLEANENVKSELEKKYLSLSRESMQNLTALIYDLSWLKKLNNTKRSN
ncbi:MAG: hypothetical protein L0Y79_11095 [Chlorobi bacterium]|nr:hypothetical protein [Chlorobiota bacterium]MCI0716915.1 hypothetical protein [Chlorobiota bacterium]